MLTAEQTKAIEAMAATLRAPNPSMKPAKEKPPEDIIGPANDAEGSRLEPSPPASSTRTTDDARIEDDARWARENLRWDGERVLADLANILRILVRHPDFRGRFQFNKAMGKVVNRGAIMADWQSDEICAQIQERFIPEIPSDIVAKALMVVANQNPAITGL